MAILLSLIPIFAAATARWRISINNFETSFSAPSAVCTIEIADSLLSAACCKLAICERMPSEMTKAAGPSAPRLIFWPDDKRSMDFESILSLFRMCRWAVRDSSFVLTRRLILTPCRSVDCDDGCLFHETTLQFNGSNWSSGNTPHPG